MKKYILTFAITIVSLASLASFAHAEEYTFSRDLSAGVSGDDVTALQSWLISNGYDIPAISSNSAMKGYFGSQTRQALMKYQLSIGLPNTGYFGPLTRGRIHGNYRGNSLVVTSPNGGEVWKANSNQNILWSVTGNTGVNTKVDLYLQQVNVPCVAMVGAVCNPKIYILDKNIPASTIYGWIVATDINNVQIPADDYILRVCTAGSTTNCDTSDSVFTISSPQLLGVCPSQKVSNQMPTTDYPNQNPPSTYYILNGVRRELTEFDQDWVGSNCSVPTQTVY